MSHDAGWQRRGSGRSYNSLSGHGSLIGRKSGKVIDFETRIKKCRICEHAHKFGRNPEKHDCRKNWNSNAKSMETPCLERKVI